jgi:hypothetical protein
VNRPLASGWLLIAAIASGPGDDGQVAADAARFFEQHL